MPKEYVRDALPAEKPAFMPGTQKEWERFRSSHSGDRCTKMGEFVYEIETDFESGGDTLVGIHVSHDGRTIFLNHRHSMPDGILTLLEYVQMVGFDEAYEKTFGVGCLHIPNEDGRYCDLDLRRAKREVLQT